MQNNFLPFSKPCIDQNAIDEVIACIQSGWMTTGPRVEKFTTQLQNYLHAKHVLPLTSGTAGLHLALLALNLQPNDEVITTPLTFVATANTIVIAGGKPIFVDVEPDTYNIDVSKIEKVITKYTKAIVPVHYAGSVCDMDAIYDLAQKHNLRVIEDAAHAIGAEYKNKKIGSFGDTQIFSFHPNKNITTGEGGCVTTDDDAIARSVSVNRFHGIDRTAWNRFSKEGSQHYDVIAPGFKYNMLDIQAAIGMHQLPMLDEFIQKRTILANRYIEKLAHITALFLPKAPKYNIKHAWHLFTPLIKPKVAGFGRDEFMQKMKDCNIGTGLHYTAVHLFSLYQKQFGYKKGDFPCAEHIGDNIVSLPLFPAMTLSEQNRVLDAIERIFKNG